MAYQGNMSVQTRVRLGLSVIPLALAIVVAVILMITAADGDDTPIIIGAALVVASIVGTGIFWLVWYQRSKGGTAPRKSQRITSENDTIRIPIEPEDPRYDAKTAELEKHTKAFLGGVKFHPDFESFLKQNGNNKPFGELLNDYKSITIEMGENFSDEWIIEGAQVIKENNLELLVRNNDYFTQFRNIIIFAHAECGHEYLFLDYGKNPICPTVKHLDDESDAITLVADSFSQFCIKFLK